MKSFKNILWIQTYRALSLLRKQQIIKAEEHQTSLERMSEQIKVLDPDFSTDEYIILSKEIKLGLLKTRATIDKIKKTNVKIKDIEDSWNLLSSIIILALTLAFGYLYSAHFSNGSIKDIQIQFYIVIAGLLPIFLIALSVYSSKDVLTKKAYMSEVISMILPVFVGLLACLIAIGANKSNAVLFWLALYALIQLLSDFLIKGFKKAIPKNVID